MIIQFNYFSEVNLILALQRFEKLELDNMRLYKQTLTNPPDVRHFVQLLGAVQGGDEFREGHLSIVSTAPYC